MASSLRTIDFGDGVVPSDVASQPAFNGLSWDVMRSHAPQAQLAVLDGAGRVVSHASIWWEGTAQWNGLSTGVIGHYGAANDQAARVILDEACARLAARGCAVVVGPMDGNTWRRYRLLTQRGDEPIFFLEPDNPDDWPTHFTAAGFAPLANYFSSISDDLASDDPRADVTIERLRESGITIRPVNLDRFDDELRSIHALSLEAFASNFLYSPIAREEFVAMYRPVRSSLSPEMVWLAERESELIGFMFAIPDLNQARHGQPIDTAIAKSIAVKPGHEGAGLGGALIELSRRAARAMGMRRFIYALMHEDNRSTKLAARFGRPFRRYALYSRRVSS